MSAVLEAVRGYAQTQPDNIAVSGVGQSLSYSDLQGEVEKLSAKLLASGSKVLGVFADNSPAWIIIDLAAVAADIVLVPLPVYFSDRQLVHVIQDTGIDVVFTDQHSRIKALNDSFQSTGAYDLFGGQISCVSTSSATTQIDIENISKITYTSGTTGAPKGVCLTQETLDKVAKSLALASDGKMSDLHLSVFPLAMLLENVGVYSVLLSGATSIQLPLIDVGMHGSSGLDVKKMCDCFVENNVTTTIMSPQMLLALCHYLSNNKQHLSKLRFLAVGGAHVHEKLLALAVNCSLPVYQGYGLSECGSVVCLNTVVKNKASSVGLPLPHVEIKISDDGEVCVKGALFRKYLSETPVLLDSQGFYQTGDLGYMDDEGFLYIVGRKKHVFITSFGRNVSPEWPEEELNMQTVIAQSVVYGEGMAINAAIIVPVQNVTETQIDKAVTAVNTTLPDYSRIGVWLYADEPFSIMNQQLTSTGRLRRQIIWSVYGERIVTRYKQKGELFL
ncbi:MAG: AMP-binding protein [Gammaproteobacteria bacterium]|nr:AMP-binding protein [Gammaproteobacteria bacterium]